jgi:acyl-CoA thioesterase-1
MQGRLSLYLGWSGSSGSYGTAKLVQRLLIAMVLFMSGHAAPAYSASKTLLVLGDSLSAEYGLPRDSGWVYLLQQQLRKEKHDVAIINASISGETTSGGKSRLPSLLQQHKPALVLIELGGNDGLRGLSLAATQANLREMMAMSTTTGAKLILVGMRVPPNYGVDYSKRFAAMYQGLGREKNVRLVPFLLQGLDNTELFFQPDRIHPNQRAQAIMMENVWQVLKPMLR